MLLVFRRRLVPQKEDIMINGAARIRPTKIILTKSSSDENNADLFQKPLPFHVLEHNILTTSFSVEWFQRSVLL
jgi:hypothetical protein